MTAFLTIFFTVFLAELGDKTQLATLLYASDGARPRWLVFAGSALALVLSSGLAVLAGAAAERWLAVVPLKLVAGIGFILVGLWTIHSHFRPG